jgi:hypothetical protein
MLMSFYLFYNLIIIFLLLYIYNQILQLAYNLSNGIRNRQVTLTKAKLYYR